MSAPEFNLQIAGEALDAQSAVSNADLRWARLESFRRDKSMTELLEERLACAPAVFVARLAATLRMPAATLEDLRAESPAFDLIPYADASRRACLALRNPEGRLSVVLGDPYDVETQDWIDQRIDAPFRYRVAHRADIVAFLAQQENRLRALDGVTADIRPEQDAPGPREHGQDLSFETLGDSDSTVVRLVNSTLHDALKAGASDVHLECTAAGLSIKYRIDGVLTPVETIAGVELSEQVVSRIKVMSELDIAERRVPQDGRFKARIRTSGNSVGGREVDFRVSIMPSVNGEDAVLRVLDKQALSEELRGLSLETLGFDPDMRARLRRLSSEPYGMLLVTGPTGSGKTTTLYAVISEVNRGRDKIVTIEDPVEYQLPGVLQIPVNEAKGLTFARGLRSILRHDPDRIMVGEIRDPETSEIAIQSALTGHLVYTTVHANNVFDVLGRFTHMGVDVYNFVSALNGVLAQRLVRVLCRNCAVPHRPEDSLIEQSRLEAGTLGEYRFMRGRGCAQCRGTGYKGRKAVAELLVMTDEMRELIIARAPLRRLKEAARTAGTRSLRESALALVRAGETTLEEINRVTLVA